VGKAAEYADKALAMDQPESKHPSRKLSNQQRARLERWRALSSAPGPLNP